MAMVVGLFYPISSLCGRRQNWRLRVKLVRLWKMTFVANPNDPYATQMVFVDEESVDVCNCIQRGRIEVTVPKQHMNRFNHSLVEGQIYNITNFGLLHNSGKFRATVHEFKLIFNATTRVIPSQNVSIPFSGYALTKTCDIKKTNGRSNYLFGCVVDCAMLYIEFLLFIMFLTCFTFRFSSEFMGIVTAVSKELNISKEGRQTRLMLLDLVDEMGQIRLALFREMIYVVVGFLSLPRCGLPVLKIQLAKVNLYNGEVGIQYVFNASKVYWNPDIAEAIEFRNGSRLVSMKDEFLKLYPKKSVAQLQEMDEDGFFIILAIIDQVIEDGFWWYMACPCMISVSYDDGVPFCEDCDSYVFDLTPRFKLKVEVVKSSAHPSRISDLVGTELLFRVERKDEPTFTYEECFRVKRVCLDPDIIADYKSELDDQTPLQLKFAPTFTKIGGGECNKGAIDLSP
ncbi:Nucleic acid-binding, OB-fold [Sesbania bispinosa]|nr:Nucleic acid-binding, OB-fold [Sesbania bispinosa]